MAFWGFSRATYVSSTLRILCIRFRKPPCYTNTTNDSCSLLRFYGWRYRLRSYVLRVKAECTTIVLSANELLVFPSRQRYFVFLRCVFIRGTPQLPLFGFLFSLARNIYCRVYPVKPHGETASVPQTFRSTHSSPYRGDNLLRKVFKSAVYCSTIYHSSLTSRKVTYLYLP